MSPQDVSMTDAIIFIGFKGNPIGYLFYERLKQTEH